MELSDNRILVDEIWKEVEGYDDYLVSNFGRVKTRSRKIRYTHSLTQNEHFRMSVERLLKIYSNNRTGYKFVQLYNDKKRKNLTIHRLVAIAFVENQNLLDYVNHKDGNKHNNRFDNLEWCSNEYNHEHATKTGLKAKGSEIGGSKLNERSVSAIKKLLLNGVSHADLADAFSVSRATISMIHEGRTWKHLK